MLGRVVHVLILVAMIGMVVVLVFTGPPPMPLDPPSWLENPYPVQVER